jgi:hypothetical protein
MFCITTVTAPPLAAGVLVAAGVELGAAALLLELELEPQPATITTRGRAIASSRFMDGEPIEARRAASARIRVESLS